MIWLGTLIGRDGALARRGQGVAFMVVFPLTFVSNAFVPADGLPDGLRQVAEWNPISAVVGRRARPVRQPDGDPGATRPGRCSTR